MTQTRSVAVRSFRSILAFATALAVVFAINLLLHGSARACLPEQLSATGLPTTLFAQLIFQAIGFSAGFFGAIVLIILAPGAPWKHALAFGAVGLILDTVTVANTSDQMPSWFGPVLLAAVPLQVSIGAWLGVWIARSKRRNRTTHGDLGS